MNKIGATTAEETVVITILVIFLIIAIVIVANVYGFSLFGFGQTVTRTTTAPVVCSLSLPINYTKSGSNECVYLISVSSGSPGLTYTVYLNTTGKIGSYVVGKSSFEQNITLNKPTHGTYYYLIMCNTTGSATSQNGFYYSPGGAAQLVLPC